MATDATLGIIITARDEATQALVNVERQIVQSSGRIARSGEAVARGSMQMTQGLQTATRAIAGLNTGLLSQLDPALARAASGMAALVGVTSRLGLGWATLAGTSAIAAAGVGAYVSVLTDAARRQAELNRAVEALDFGGVVSQVRGMRIELEALDRGVLGKLLSATRTPGALNILDILAGRPALEAGIESGRAAASQLAPFELNVALKGEAVKVLDTMRAYQVLESARAKEVLDVERLEHAYSTLSAILTTQIELERELVEVQAKRNAAALHAAGMPPDVVATVFATRDAQLATIGETGRNRRLALAEQRRLDIAGVRERTPSGQPSAADEDFTSEFTEAQLLMMGRDFARAAQREESARAIEIYGIHGRSLDLARNLPTVTRGQQEAVERELSFRRETLGMQVLDVEGRRQPERRDVIDAQRTFLREEERVVRERLDVERSVRTEAAAGLAAELARLEEDFDAAGDRMAAVARETAGTMHRAFSDGFFTVLTGDFKRLPDLGRDIGRQMVRTLSDELARMALSPIIRQLRAAFGGGGGAGGFSLMPAGALTGGGSVLNVTGASSSQLASLSQNGYTITRTNTGQTLAVPSLGGAPAPGAGGEFLASPVFRQPAVETTAAYQASYSEAYIAAIEAGATPAQANASGTAAANAATTQTGVTVGQAVGYGAAGVGVGLTAYGIYQGGVAGGGESGDEGTAYVMGGLQGAVVGAGVGALFGGVGAPVGAGVGLVVGVALTALGEDKGTARRRRRARREKRQRMANQVARETQEALARDDLDAADLVRLPLSSGNSLGGLWMNIAGQQMAGNYVDSVLTMGWAPDPNSRELYEHLAALGVQPEDFSGFHIESVNELVWNMGKGPTSDLIAMFLDRLRDVFSLELAVESREVISGVGPLAVRTFVSASTLAASGRPGPGETLFATDTFMRQLESDPIAAQQLAAMIFRAANDAGIQVVPVTAF